MQHLAFACVAALNEPSKSTSFYVDHLAWAMAAHLVETHGRGSIVPSIVHYPGLTDRQLKRAQEYMLEHMDGDLGVEDLAAAAGLSPVYFARQFKLRTGSAPPLSSLSQGQTGKRTSSQRLYVDCRSCAYMRLLSSAAHDKSVQDRMWRNPRRFQTQHKID